MISSKHFPFGVAIGLAAPALSQDTEAIDLTDYQGGLLVDIYLMDKGRDTADAKPSELAIGRFVDNGPPIFNRNAFRQEEFLARFGDTDSLGFMWHGFLEIEEQGRYIFSQEINRGSLWMNCTNISEVGDKQLIAIMDRNGGALRNITR